MTTESQRRRREAAYRKGLEDGRAAGRLAGARVPTDAMVETACIVFHSLPPANVNWSIQTEHFKNTRRADMRAALVSALAEPAAEIERCPVCDEPFKAGDIYASDIELMTCHAACLEGAPVVDMDTGEPVEGPIDTFTFEPDGDANPIREAETAAARDVLTERRRQIEAEGWTPEHDNVHSGGQIAAAAACYAAATLSPDCDVSAWLWPWGAEWWKPSDPRRNLVKAGALILAEIERRDRAALAERAKP